ncbi:MAG: hypothetical protein IMHGJWDQ_001401 [Candidatus Fervidibacter sp.]
MLVELAGKAGGLMSHLLRGVEKGDRGEIVGGDETELAEGFAFYGWMWKL